MSFQTDLQIRKRNYNLLFGRNWRNAPAACVDGPVWTRSSLMSSSLSLGRPAVSSTGRIVVPRTNAGVAAFIWSDDGGVTWNDASAQPGGSFTSGAIAQLRWTGSRFVGLRTNAAAITSVDGDVWTTPAISSVSTVTGGSAVDENGRYYYGSTVRFAYTDDGTNWTVIAQSGGGYAVACAGSRVVVFGVNGIYYTDNSGVSFSTLTNPFGLGRVPRAVAYSPDLGRIVGVDQVSGSADAYASYSDDGGVTWTINSAAMPSTSDWTDIVYGQGRFVVVGSNLRNVPISADGASWAVAPNLLPSTSSDGASYIAFNGTNKYVAGKAATLNFVLSGEC